MGRHIGFVGIAGDRSNLFCALKLSARPPSEHGCISAACKELRISSELEAKTDRGIDCIAIEVTVSPSVIDLREHEAGVSIKLRRKPPIHGE
jgi:hypothetical protein